MATLIEVHRYLYGSDTSLSWSTMLSGMSSEGSSLILQGIENDPSHYRRLGDLLNLLLSIILCSIFLHMMQVFFIPKQCGPRTG